MTGTWAKKLARHQIRVAGIAPGFCDTRMAAKIPPKIIERIVSTIPLWRLARPEDITGAAPFATTISMLDKIVRKKGRFWY